MKKTFTLITALLVSACLFAFPNKGILTISSSSKSPVDITIDNRDCNENNSNDIVISDIKAGYHNIKVFRESRQWNKKKQLLYNGNIYIKPGFHIDITINRFGKAFIDERKIVQGWYDDEDNNDDSGGWDNEHQMQSMSQNEFSQFKQTISNSSFESTKLALAKQVISKNNFTAAQVKETVGLFSFESSKLDIAKTAYRATTDKSNYFIVSDALGYNSSKEELATFLETSRD
jgi:hypothetical protein